MRKRWLLLITLGLFVAFSSLVVVAQDDVTTIEYWQYFFDARVNAMNELIAQFEAENPDIHVVHNSDIPYEEFQNKIAASAPMW